MGFSCFYGAEKVLKKSRILILSFEWEPCDLQESDKEHANRNSDAGVGNVLSNVDDDDDDDDDDDHDHDIL